MKDTVSDPLLTSQDIPIQQANSKKKNKPLLLLLLGLVILLGLLILMTSTPLKSLTNSTSISTSSLLLSATPTPISFVEMTIPYLRERTYQSNLGERELVSDNGNYSLYLTSYISDGLTINGLLTIPNGTKSDNGWPAIVFIHGYIPPTLYVTTEKYVDYVDYLARSGFVVFKIDLRGHGNSEGKPGGGYFGSDYVIDALNAYTALQSSDFVNAKSIGMWGHSMAGNVLLRSMAAKPEIPAIVIWAGAVYSYEDQRKYGINDQSYRPPQIANQQNSKRRELFEKYGTPSAQSTFWQQVAPTNYLQDLKGAIQIDHAEDDSVVDIGYSRDLMSLLDKTNVPHEFFTYPTGGHNIEGASFTLAMQRTTEFFKKYLK